MSDPVQSVPSNPANAADTPASRTATSQSSVQASSHHHHRRHRSPLRRTWRKIRKAIAWRLVIAVILVVVIVPVAGVVVFTTDSLARVRESLNGFKRVTDTLKGGSFANFTLTDLDRLQVSVHNLSDSLRYAREQTSLLHIVSFVNPDLAANNSALAAAEETALAAQDMLTGLKPTIFFLVNGDDQNTVVAQISSGERVVELLQVGQGQFVSAQNHLKTAQQLIKNLNFKNISPDFLLQLRDLTQYQDTLVRVNTILLDAPNLISNAFAMNDPRDYLILSENSDELRPSGGYISTYGWLHLRRFRITDYGYSATTSVSPNPPPAELVSDLHIPDWWIQFPHPIYTAFDGSWYADFPSTAEMAAWFYEKGNNPRSPVQGVIAIDIIGFQRILEGLGSVSVPGYDEVVTPDNFREVVYRIRAEGDGDAPHKQFLAALYKQILQDWQTLSQKSGTKIIAATISALQEKHIMVYFRDPKLNEVMNLLGWTGAQTPGNYDYLMVADANLGNKSNHSIARDLTYDVAIQTDGTIKSRASISYDYSDAVASKDPAVKPEHYRTQKDYGNLMQVFVPKGSVVTNTDNLPSDLKTASWQNLDILIATTLVKYDTSERYQFTYTTPALIESFGSYQRYRLLLQKQPGTLGDTVHVQIMLPPHAKVISTSPKPATSYTLDNPILEFQTQLVTDQWIEIIYQ